MTRRFSNVNARLSLDCSTHIGNHSHRLYHTLEMRYDHGHTEKSVEVVEEAGYYAIHRFAPISNLHGCPPKSEWIQHSHGKVHGTHIPTTHDRAEIDGSGEWIYIQVFHAIHEGLHEFKAVHYAHRRNDLFNICRQTTIYFHDFGSGLFGKGS